jgi:hypothetical protein
MGGQAFSRLYQARVRPGADLKGCKGCGSNGGKEGTSNLLIFQSEVNIFYKFRYLKK